MNPDSIPGRQLVVCAVEVVLAGGALPGRWHEHNLATLTAHIGHEFNHHHAQADADAEAAGRVLLAMMKHANATTPRDLLQKASLQPKRFCE
jgi:DNA polymerase III alpha subunit (gram-positive type)